MKLTTEQEEAEAAKAAETDASAMEKLLQEEPPPPETETPPPETAPEVTDKAEPQPTKEEPPPEKPAQPPPPEAAAPDVKPKDTPAEQDDFEKELSSNKYELPAGSTRSAREIIKAVKNHATEEHRRFREATTARETAERLVQELQTKLTSATKDSEELQRYRPIVQRLAIEQDPNFNANFDHKIAGIERRLIENLQTWGLGEDAAKYIMEHGGPAYFSKDSTSTVEAEAEDGSDKGVRMSHKQFWEQRVLNQLSDENKNSVRLAFDDELRIREARSATLRDALANRDKYFKDLEEQSVKHEEAFRTECRKELEAQRKDLGDIVSPWEIPKNATEEERKGIEAHNTALKEASAKFDQFFVDTSPKALITKNLGGLLLPHMKTLLAEKDAIIAQRDAKIAEQQKRWDASLKAANTSHRQSVQQQPKPVQGIDLDDGRRMEKMLEDLPA